MVSVSTEAVRTEKEHSGAYFDNCIFFRLVAVNISERPFVVLWIKRKKGIILDLSLLEKESDAVAFTVALIVLRIVGSRYWPTVLRSAPECSLTSAPHCFAVFLL